MKEHPNRQPGSTITVHRRNDDDGSADQNFESDWIDVGASYREESTDRIYMINRIELGITNHVNHVNPVSHLNALLRGIAFSLVVNIAAPPEIRRRQHAEVRFDSGRSRR
jgi:hypothetical protein